jgi:Leucine-rich repeat (LRR) protein
MNQSLHIKTNKMKKILLLLLLLVAGMAKAQNITIPDPVFKAKVLASTAANAVVQNNMGVNIQIDADNDGEISILEAMEVYGLDIGNLNYDAPGPFITDMTGIDNFPNLRSLKCGGHQITSLDLTFLSSLRTLDCSHNQLTSLVADNLIQIEYLDCSFNHITSLDVSMLTTLQHLDCRANLSIPSINVAPLTNLQFLSVGGNALTSLDVSTLASLKNLDCSANQITALNLPAMPLLEVLFARDNLLTSIDLTPVPNLIELDLGQNSLTTVDITNMPDLKHFSCEINQISSIDFSGQTQLNLAFVANNLLTTLDLSQMPQLYFLDCGENQISTLDLTLTPMLGALICDNNLLTTIDVSGCLPMHNLDCRNNQLETLFLKNGAITSAASNFDFSGNANLEYICADEGEAAFIQSKIVDYGYTNCFVSTYCTFTPGGNYNTITGTILLDSNNNGCESSDPKEPNIKLSINDGTTTGATFTNVNGNYNFYTAAGDFTIAPQVENPSFFNFSPATTSAAFADANNNVSTNNFCVTANGIHPDAEIVIAPLTRARPGFDATYKIVYKNKGNQILSGNVVFNYDDSVLDLISVSTPPNVQSAGQLQWNYTNLLPFESRSVTITLNVNSPLETPAVNLDDILVYSATINPIAGDESTADNQFTFNHTVVNAFDPNEITCLEGDSVATDAIGEYLHYIANFENLGTADAENVVVRIDVDPTQYDINSLQMLNTSHNSYTRVTGNTVEFIFEDINLEAAQGNPPVGGHGNILFKIRSKDNLVSGDTVTKMANIFFDYNAPVTTDIAETTFASLKKPDFEQDNSLEIYPNPTTGMVTIKSDFEIKSIELFDIQGRVLQTSIESLNTTSLDLSARAKGMYFLRITTSNGTNVEKVIKN